MPTLTLVFLAAYLGGVLAIGFFWRRRAGRDEASYFVADRSLDTFWGFIGLSSLTTGGSTTIALAAFVYIHGLSGLWLDLAGALGLLALGLFLARRVRREGAVTLPEIVGRYYGPRARWAAALLVLVSEIVWFALLVEGTQVVLTAAFSLEPTLAIVVSTAVFVVYTSLGGQFAVVRTDLLQYGLMVVGIPGIALVCALRRFHDFAALPEALRQFPLSPTVSTGDVAALLVLIGLPHLVGSDVYAKILSCRDEATARRSALLAAGSKVLFGLAVAALALAARQTLPPGSPGLALPRAVLAFVPGPLASLVLVSLVATLQTSADVVLLSAAAVTARDLLPPLTGRPTALSTARLLSPLYGGLGLAVALAMGRNVIETLRLGYSVFAAGLILPVLAAFLPPRWAPPPAGAIVAMLAGGAVAAAGRFHPALTGARDPVLVGTAVNLAVLVISRLASAAAPRPRPTPASAA
ncbi:MAG: sodium:solute symporter family protein [Acidobacteriota bacterium]